MESELATPGNGPAAGPALRARRHPLAGESASAGFPVTGTVTDTARSVSVARSLGVAEPSLAVSPAGFVAAQASGLADRILAEMPCAAVREVELEAA